MEHEDAAVSPLQIQDASAVRRAWEMHILPIYHNFDTLTWDIIQLTNNPMHDSDISSLPIIPAWWHQYANRILGQKSSIVNFHYSQCKVYEIEMKNCYHVLEDEIHQDGFDLTVYETWIYWDSLLKGVFKRTELLRHLVKAMEDQEDQFEQDSNSKRSYASVPIKNVSSAQGM